MLQDFQAIKETFNKNKIGWIKSFDSGFSKDCHDNYTPWFTYPAIDFLKSQITKNHSIFEFGSGASTLFFSKNCSNVFSLETNLLWFNMMKDLLEKNECGNVEFKLVEDAISEDKYEKYLFSLNKKFDFIIIDSIKRFECVKNSISFLKEDGFLILDDSQRKSYKKIFHFLTKENNFKQIDFIGISPGQINIKNTSFFTISN